MNNKAYNLDSSSSKDYQEYLRTVIKAKNDPVYFVENVLGQQMFPIQKQMFHEFYQDRYDPSKDKNKFFYLVGGMRCVSRNTRILTSNGYKPIENIINSDKVFTIDGWSEVKELIDCGEKEEWIITSENGYSLSCSAEHKFYTFDGEEYKWKEAKELLPSDYIEVRCEEPSTTNSINKNNAIIIGLLISEGCLTNPKVIDFSNKDEELNNIFLQCIKEEYNYEPSIYINNSYDNCYHSKICKKDIVRQIKLLGLTEDYSWNKFIPQSIFSTSINNKRWFLKALFSGDGSITLSSNRAYIAYTTSSKILARDIQLLLLSFDIISNISYRKPYLNRKEQFTIKIQGINLYKYYTSIGFLCSTKQNKLITLLSISHTSRGYYSINIPIKESTMKKYFKNNKSINKAYYGIESRVPRDKLINNQITDDKLRFIDTSNYYFKIKSIVNTNKKVQMYDLYVPNGSSYIANGIMVHNSGKTALASMFFCYELFDVCTMKNPAEYYKLMKGQDLFLIAVAVSQEIASDGVFSNVSNMLETSEWCNTWLDLDIKSEKIDCESKHVHAKVLSSWANTAVGRTSKCVVFDELDLFESTAGKRGAWEIYTRLSKSTATLKLDGKVIAISSPQTPTGIMMSLYKRGVSQPNTISHLYKSYEMNPNLNREELMEEFKHDMPTFYRDFECRPEIAGAIQFPDGVSLTQMPNILFSTKISPYIHTMSIDPSYRNDSFGLAVGYRMDDTIIIDGIHNFRRQEGDPFIRPSEVWEFIDSRISKLNINSFIFDVWGYPEILEKLMDKYGIEAIKHIVRKEDYDRMKEMWEDGKLNVIYEEVLQKELEELLVKNVGSQPKCDHPFSGSKDSADAVANCIWHLSSNVELEDTTPQIIFARSF